MQEKKPNLRTRITVLAEVITELLRRNAIGIILTVGMFALGYSLKNIGDRNERATLYAQLAEQRQRMAAECDARLVEAKDMTTEQTGRIEEQTELIHQLKDIVGNVQLTQKQQVHVREAELETMKKAASAAQTAVTEVTKGATEKDRQQINAVVKGKNK